jgi:hypothetical protein
MNINRENYEAIMLDFMEGRLSVADQDEVLDFLMLNPDVMEEIKDLNALSLEPEKIVFDSKHRLTKTFPDQTSKPDVSNFEMFAIAYLENDLEPEQSLEFETFLSENKDHQQAFELWSKTKLPAEFFLFPFKKELKKKVVRSGRSIWIMIPTAIAASLAILFIILTDPVIPESISELEEAVAAPDKNVQIAEMKPADSEITKNPIIISEKEKAIHPELLGNRNGKNDESASNSQTLQDSGEDFTKPEQNDSKGKRTKLLSGVDFGRDIIADFQPEPDKITSLNPPVNQVYYSSLIKSGMARLDIGKTMEEFTKEDLSLWNIATHGIEGVNKLIGTDMELLASKNEDGKVSRFRFTSRILKISAPVQHQKSGNDN